LISSGEDEATENASCLVSGCAVTKFELIAIGTQGTYKLFTVSGLTIEFAVELTVTEFAAVEELKRFKVFMLKFQIKTPNIRNE
jgi:hypothetical protein